MKYELTYTNIDGIIPKNLVLTENSRIVCLADTKLFEDIQINIEDNIYHNILRKDKKG